MTPNPSSKPGSTSLTVGASLLVAGIVLGLFTYAHRPPSGFMDALQRGDSWAFKSEAYYGLLLLSALLGIAGIVRVAGYFK